MFLQNLKQEQLYLQNLWNSSGFPGQVAYVSREGWWVVLPNRDEQTPDMLFLGRVVEQAQHAIRETSAS